MTDLGVDVRTYLLTKSDVTDIVSTRVRPDALTQEEALPAVAYQETDTTHEQHLTAAAGILHARLHLDCYADTRRGANSLAETIRTQLHGYRGSAGSATILACELVNRTKGYDPPPDGSDDGRYVTSLAFRITAEETAPSF